MVQNYEQSDERRKKIKYETREEQKENQSQTLAQEKETLAREIRGINGADPAQDFPTGKIHLAGPAGGHFLQCLYDKTVQFLQQWPNPTRDENKTFTGSYGMHVAYGG